LSNRNIYKDFLGTLHKSYLPAADFHLDYIYTYYISSILKASVAMDMKHVIKKVLW